MGFDPRPGPGEGVSAALTCSSRDRSVFWSTKLMSGCAMSAPCPSTTKACPALPTLIWETTSQMNLRFTSAAVTPPPCPPSAMAMAMYGSDSLRKYTGPR